MGELPTETVTLLLADVEGSTLLWETQPDEMTAAIARLDRAVCDLVGAHGGVLPVEQGEGDSFVAAFARASDAVACALELQRSPLAPIRLRIGVHTGETQLRDNAKYAGPMINRTARLRDLAHGGQTLLSGATEAMVVDRLPDSAWLTDLGTHPLRDLPRPERVVQLCHLDLGNEFPPLRTTDSSVAHNFPAQLTSFVGRQAEMTELFQVVADNRLVTLTGAGGVGKTRLAVEVTAQMADDFFDRVWFVDLAPVADPAVVAVAVARTVGLPDQPGRSTLDTLLRFVGERAMLLLLDNCEHLLDACGGMIMELLNGCPQLTILTTSREPIGLTGELTWPVPSLPLGDEAIELFTDRAQRARPDFRISDQNADLVAEICRRLDGMPLAIELAAARVRALSLTQIVDSLNDRFRLLTGGARTAVRRQQTLRASVDWSHALLTESERALFRRLGVFLGGFDLDAAQAVAGSTDLERFEVLDQLALLVDKSLVVAEDSGPAMRYRMLETVRQYALEMLGESGEADAVRTRHRDYYTHFALLRDASGAAQVQEGIDRAVREIDNLRAAFAWSREGDDIELAVELASALQPLWLARGRVAEGLAWFDALHINENAGQSELAPRVLARALADKALLNTWAGADGRTEQAEQAVAIAREIDDPQVLTRALAARCIVSTYDPQVAQQHFTEAIELARATGDQWALDQVLGWRTCAAYLAGDPQAGRAAGEEGLALAEAIGDKFHSRQCRVWLGWALTHAGDLVRATAQFREVIAEARLAQDASVQVVGLGALSRALTYQGDTSGARAAVRTAADTAADLGDLYDGSLCAILALAALAAGDVAEAARETEAARRKLADAPISWTALTVYHVIAEIALALGDLITARLWSDEAVSTTMGGHRCTALTTRARVAIAQGEPQQAERDLHEAIGGVAKTKAYLGLPDALECLAGLIADAGGHRVAARLFGAADAIRQHMGHFRFKVHQASYDTAVATVRDALGEKVFDAARAEGAALSTAEAIAYAQRGRGERKRPTTGWESLTPTERDVARLVGQGLGNKDIATRLFISPRTVQTHLTHIYNKLGLSSRVQLAQEVARHA